MKIFKVLMVEFVIVLGLTFVSVNLNGCGTVAGIIVGEAAKANYKKTHKQCPHCKSWMELDASVCPECKRDYNINQPKE